MQRFRRPARRFTLPVDPWPRETLGERMAIGFVLIVLLLLPFFAAGAVCLRVTAAVLHVDRSHDLGAALRGHLDRRVFGRAVPAGGTRPAQVARRP